MASPEFCCPTKKFKVIDKQSYMPPTKQFLKSVVILQKEICESMEDMQDYLFFVSDNMEDSELCEITTYAEA